MKGYGLRPAELARARVAFAVIESAINSAYAAVKAAEADAPDEMEIDILDVLDAISAIKTDQVAPIESRLDEDARNAPAVEADYWRSYNRSVDADR